MATAQAPPFTQRELDRFEQQVLELLCQKGHYGSSVALAADIYETTEAIQEERVLEYNLVELLLADLNEMGLVVYRLSEGAGRDFEVIVRIRPTQEAYKLLRIQRHWIRQTNFGQWHNLNDTARHATDMTNFENHAESAVGVGPVVKEDFIEHCSGCNHLSKHRMQLVELYGTDEL